MPEPTALGRIPCFNEGWSCSGVEQKFMVLHPSDLFFESRALFKLSPFHPIQKKSDRNFKETESAILHDKWL